MDTKTDVRLPRCVIVGGAKIGDPAAVRAYLRADDFTVACDAGLYNADALGVAPDLIVGDFDSHPMPETDVELIALPREKDDTDTVFAVRECVRRGFRDFLLVGVTGGRLDHTLGNISILLCLDTLGRTGMIIDDNAEYAIVSPRAPAKVGGGYKYFSLLAVGGAASGVTITGAKYPLAAASIVPDYQYGVSNEIASGADCASVAVERGRVLLYRVR